VESQFQCVRVVKYDGKYIWELEEAIVNKTYQEYTKRKEGVVSNACLGELAEPRVKETAEEHGVKTYWSLVAV
jgi:hypothetical protein